MSKFCAVHLRFFTPLVRMFTTMFACVLETLQSLIEDTCVELHVTK